MAKVHPRYEFADFGEWSFEEFPLAIYPGAPDPRKPVYYPKGDPKYGQLKFPAVIVADEDELRAHLSNAATVEDATSGATRLRTAADDVADLQKEAEDIGLTYDKRWTAERLTLEITNRRKAIAGNSDAVV